MTSDSSKSYCTESLGNSILPWRKSKTPSINSWIFSTPWHHLGLHCLLMMPFLSLPEHYGTPQLPACLPPKDVDGERRYYVPPKGSKFLCLHLRLSQVEILHLLGSTKGCFTRINGDPSPSGLCFVLEGIGPCHQLSENPPGFN